MSPPLSLKCGLLLGLLAFPALAREIEDKLRIRTLQVPAHPGQEAPSIYVSAQVASVLRFEQDVVPAKTRLLAWEGRFEPLLVGSKKVVIEPLRDLDEGGGAAASRATMPTRRFSPTERRGRRRSGASGSSACGTRTWTWTWWSRSSRDPGSQPPW